MRTTWISACGLGLCLTLALAIAPLQAQKYVGGDGTLRVALVKQPLSPNGPSKGPTTMAEGGIQRILADLGATVRVDEARLTPLEETEYGGWKKLGLSLGHFADLVTKNERDGYFTVGLLATCPSMPGLVAGLQRSGSTLEALRIGMLWLDAHPDFNTPETTRSGSLGGMPVAVATGRALQVMRLRRQARSAALGPPRRDGRRPPDRPARAAPARQLDDRTAHCRRPAPADAGRLGPARSPRPHQRQALHPHRHGRARPARSDGPRQQGARTARRASSSPRCSRRSSAAIRRHRRLASRPFRRPTRAGCRLPR